MRCKALVQALIPYTSGDTDLVTADAARGCLLQLGHLKDKAAVAAADNSADAAGNDALVSEYSVSLGLMLHSVGCNSALPPPSQFHRPGAGFRLFYEETILLHPGANWLTYTACEANMLPHDHV